MIELGNVTVRYGRRAVLRGVGLTVGAGERVALLGPNGAGKTTLLRSVLGLTPYGGTIRVGGHDARAQGVAARVLLGYVPQVPAFPSGLVAAEVVAFFQELRGLAPAPEGVLRAVGLAEYAGEPVRTFSGGMLRRLALAVARLGDPPVVLLDEPTSHLDREGEGLVRAWLEEAGARGLTVVLATHHLGELEPFVDRLVLLENGAVVANAPVARLRAHQWLEVVTTPPVPDPLPSSARVLPVSNGAVSLRVAPDGLAELVRALGARPLSVREPALETVLRETGDLREEDHR